MRNEFLKEQLAETIRVVQHVQERLDDARQVALVIIEALRSGHRLLLCGNGGSALQAQHFASELVGHYRTDRNPLPALALTTDGGVLTCIANDYNFDSVFARQVKAFGRPGDILIGFSTSGNSRNVVAALDTAREIGMHTIGFAGGDGGQFRGRCDYELFIPSSDTARIQEGHLVLVHILTEFIDEAFAGH